MECTNLVDPHQLLCPCFTVVFVLFCIYTTDNQFPRPIVKQGGGLFWILSDSNVSLEKQIWFTNAFIWRTISNLEKKEKTEWNVFFNHMVGIKTTREQISILCHNENIFDKPREKLDWPSKVTLECERILRLVWQSVLGTDCRGYICKIVRIQQ